MELHLLLFAPQLSILVIYASVIVYGYFRTSQLIPRATIAAPISLTQPQHRMVSVMRLRTLRTVRRKLLRSGDDEEQPSSNEVRLFF